MSLDQVQVYFAVPIVIFFLLALPALLVIGLVYVFMRKLGKSKASKVWLKWSIALVFLAIISFGAYDVYQRTHRVHFTSEPFNFILRSYEFNSFLDWPIEHNLEVSNEITGVTQSFTFTSDGPYLKFTLIDEGNLLVDGYGISSVNSWLLDLDSGKVEDFYQKTSADTLQGHSIAKLNGNFEIANP